MLSDVDIAREIDTGGIVITPELRMDQLQPASIDLTLGHGFVWDGAGQSFFMDELTLLPGDFYLGTTAEDITLNHQLVARVEGKSTLGRRGLAVHITAGFIDPGFSGQITLEMVNHSRKPITVKVGQRICQVSFDRLESSCHRPYGSEGLGSHYQGQQGVTTARVGDV